MSNVEQTELPNDTEDLAAAIKDANEIWAVVGRGGLAFRHGPFTAQEAGPLMERAVDEGVGMMFTINVGRDIDWDAMREIAPATYEVNSKASSTEEDTGNG